MGRLALPVIFGFGGVAVLLSLAVWQWQRLGWKEGLIAEIEARMAAAPVALPAEADATRHGFLSVAAEGRFRDPALHVLSSVKGAGPGFRVVQGFETGGRVVLVDRGFVAEADKAMALDPGPLQVRGNLLWPDEADMFTPAPNLERNIWFARDLDAMAEALGAEPVLISANRPTGTPSPLPLPVGVNLPNNHLQYVITWSLLASVWLAMTIYLLIRIRRDADKGR